jgi:metallo-beta-lactamase family protein
MGKNILLDCGLFQGNDEEEGKNENFPFQGEDIDYVILSHSHIDHSGRIPLLYKRGYKGQVYCTEATKALSSVMLRDSGHIAEMEVEWKNRKRMRQGLPPVEPIYTAQDADRCIVNFLGFDYDETIEIFEGLKIRFRDSGHMLGGAIVELFIKEEDKEEIKLVYSGDLGNVNRPILKDPTYLKRADYLIMETTYGNRIHKNAGNEIEKLVDIIKETFKRGGNVVIPTFAVGRAQEVLYALNKHVENGDLKNITVYLDSPLAQEATKVFQNFTHIYDEEAKQLVDSGDDPFFFKGLVFTKSAQESTQINKVRSGAVIISSSGMCEAGRIKHHLKHNLWRKESSIVFVGYQAEGTLGRAIIEKAKKVRIFGEEVAVNAKIYKLNGLSGHADKDGLVKWISSFRKKPKEIILVHGDKNVLLNFQKELSDKGYNASIAKEGETRYIGPDVHRELLDVGKLKDELSEFILSLEDKYVHKEELLNNINNIINNLL